MIAFYMEGSSWAHRLPAGFKLLFLLVVSAFALPIEHPVFILVLFLGCLLPYASLGKRGMARLGAVRPVLWISGVIFLFHLALGSPLIGFAAAIRLVSMVLLANFVTMTTRLDDMLAAIEPVFYPVKFIGASPARISLAVALVLRFVPVLLSTYGGLQQAYQARTGRKNSWRLLAPFALHVLKLTEQVSEALTARGGAGGFTSQEYDSTLHRTNTNDE